MALAFIGVQGRMGSGERVTHLRLGEEREAEKAETNKATQNPPLNIYHRLFA